LNLSLIYLLLLILVANGAPVIARNILASRFSTPFDFGVQFFHRDLLGPSKTWRGLIASVVATASVAILLGYAWQTGAWVALCAIAGDAFSSFIKRRLNMKTSSMAPLLDQIPESLLPALVMREAFELDAVSIVVLVCSFIVLELILSQILYRWGIRKTPY
jgi:CDP-2,3-bis-(O-geranylgeranyl)-sn-glycerol synthase